MNMVSGTPTFDTHKFVWSHGRHPKGYGQWAFRFDTEETIRWATGTYTEAKRQIQVDARREGFHGTIYVLP